MGSILQHTKLSDLCRYASHLVRGQSFSSHMIHRLRHFDQPPLLRPACQQVRPVGLHVWTHSMAVRHCKLVIKLSPGVVNAGPSDENAIAHISSNPATVCLSLTSFQLRLIINVWLEQHLRTQKAPLLLNLSKAPQVLHHSNTRTTYKHTENHRNIAFLLFKFYRTCIPPEALPSHLRELFPHCLQSLDLCCQNLFLLPLLVTQPSSQAHLYVSKENKENKL